jgi:ribonucleoside-diphosphate reductase alpha chain
MNPYDSCRLLAINLYSYVKNPFTSEAKFDFDLFKKHVNVAQRLMDDIVDLEIEKIDQILVKIKKDPEDESLKRVEKELWIKIKNTTLKGRRTGIGTTGEGDMLAALGLVYASPEGIDFSEKVHRTLAVNAYSSSIQLAKERGSFKIWNKELEKNNSYIKCIRKHLSKKDLEQYKTTGRRNISCLTIAPTGTTSIMT